MFNFAINNYPRNLKIELDLELGIYFPRLLEFGEEKFRGKGSLTQSRALERVWRRGALVNIKCTL